MGRAFFLLAVLKAVDGYPKPAFWATLYLFFILTSELMFNAAFSGFTRGMAGWAVVDWVVAYVYFSLLRATGDGLPYWATFCGGFLLLVFLIP